MGVAEPKALVNLGVDPQFSTLPQPPPDIQRCIPSVARCVRIKAVRAAIRRPEWRGVLRGQGRLAVQAPTITFRRIRRPQATPFRCVTVELVVHAPANLLRGQGRLETLAASRKRKAGVSVLRIEIFESCRPARRDRCLDARSNGPPNASQEQRLDRAGWRVAYRAVGELGAGELVVGPGKSSGHVIEPAAD